MSSTSSISPVPDLAGESRKKVTRGGKRSVTHLSKAQLARKRANDREAQRNIRQRTKEHIGNLERKVKELEQNGRSSSIERVLKRNQDLEAEIDRLRAQLTSRVALPSTTTTTAAAAAATRIASDISEDILASQKADFNWISSTSTWSNPEIPNTSNHSYPSSEAPSYTHTPFEDEPSGNIYTSITIPAWNEQAVFGQTSSQPLTKPTQAWSYPSPYQASSRFSSPVPSQNSSFSDHVSPPTYPSPCWQNQPSIYAWQMSTKMKAATPHTYMDQLMLSSSSSMGEN